MSNYDTRIGLDYLHKTFYGLSELLAEGQGNEGDPGEPLKFKIYQHTNHYALRQTLPLTIGDARHSFQAFRQSAQHSPRLDVLDIAHLSTLLYYTYGFSRHDKGPGVRWPYHRVTASARCFFPAECYAWIPQVETIPAGIYHYDNLHHSLALVRPGEFRELLGHILGANLDRCLGVLLVSALFWKNAFRYRNFSYRLSTQEAGIVVGNALAVAGTLGLRAHTHYQFLDEPANRLLGFEDGEESLLAALPLYPWDGPRTGAIQPIYERRVTAQTLLEGIEPISPTYIKLSTLDRDRCASLLEIDQHTRLAAATEIAVGHIPETIICETTEERFGPPLPSPGHVELAQALHARSSGDMLLLPTALPISREAFWEVIRYALSPYVNDLGGVSAHPHLQLYVAVNNVEGIDKGMYRFCKQCGQLHLAERGDIALQTQSIPTVPNINCASSNIVCYLAGDYIAASNVTGNRGYRILQMECGLVVHRLCMMSAAHGLVARCSDSYDIQKTEVLLKLTTSSAIPLSLVAIGREQPGIGVGERYKLSIHP